MNAIDYRISDSTDIGVITVYGDFLGTILDGFEDRYPQHAGPRAVARLIEQLRYLDENVTVDLAGVHATAPHLPTVDQVMDLINERLLNVNYVVGAMSVAAEGR